MSPQSVTETIILHLQTGVNLEDVTSTGALSNPAVWLFVQLTDMVASQDGVVRQYWGHQVEDPSVFVWCIEWTSPEGQTGFMNSGLYKQVETFMGNLFDMRAAVPFRIYTRFTSSATAALSAPVTEIAFYKVSNGVREEAKTLIESDKIDSTHPVMTIGQSWGGAVGWVFDTKNPGDAVAEGESIALHGVFGYASVEDHIKWRQTAEHAHLIESMTDAPLTKLGLGDTRMPGGHVFEGSGSMFHVKFRARP